MNASVHPPAGEAFDRLRARLIGNLRNQLGSLDADLARIRTFGDDESVAALRAVALCLLEQAARATELASIHEEKLAGDFELFDASCEALDEEDTETERREWGDQ